MAKLPKWVLKHQRKGTQAVQIGNGYYLYKISSRWNPKKKRADKITDKYLGAITREGVVKPKHERVLEDLKNIPVKHVKTGYKTKIQLIERKNSRQWYVNFPMAIAKAMEFKKGEEFEWVIEDNNLIYLKRSVGGDAL